MNRHQLLAIRALEQMSNGDLDRVRAAFRNYTPDQMAMQHGQSGRTRAEILAGYDAHETKIREAIAWVQVQR